MSRERTQLLGEDIFAPTDKATNETWREGAEVLLRAALERYNYSVAALHDGNVLAALERAQSAVRLFPYCPRVLTYSLLVALQHGLYEWADQLLATAEEVGMANTVEQYEPLLRERVVQWNEQVQDPRLLREKYADADADTSYREVLFLAHQYGGELTASESQHARRMGLLGGIGANGTASFPRATPPAKEAAENATGVVPTDRGAVRHQRDSQTSQRLLARSVLPYAVAIVALFVGGGLGYVFAGGSAEENASAVTAQVDSIQVASERSSSQEAEQPKARRQQNAKQLLAVGMALSSEGKPLAALAATDSLESGEDFDEETLSELRDRIAQKVYARAENAWYRQDYGEVVRLLEPVQDFEARDDGERHYRLGLAAGRVSRDSLAIHHLIQSLEGENQRYYEGEAAYLLTQLLDEKEGRPYAERIAERFGGTVYDDEDIRKLLNNSERD